MSKGVTARELRQRIEAFQTETVTSIVRQIEEANERIKTLEAERDRLQTELAEALAQRDEARTEKADLAAKVYHATRRGW